MTEQELLPALWTSLCACTNNHDHAQEAYTRLSKIINKGGYCDTYFDDFCGVGSYKEAWQVGNICIKFATAEAASEMKVYNAAEQYDIQNIFCPTFSYRLPWDSEILCSEMDEVPMYTGCARYYQEGKMGSAKASYIMIQPLVEMRHDLTVYDNPYDYDANPLYLNDGTALSGYEYMCIDAPYEWRQDVIKCYGDAAYRNLVWGLRRLGVEDLHPGNVGWIKGKPVIIDWYSSLKPAKKP